MAEVFAQSDKARLISNGTDNHLLLLDVTGFDLTGKEAEKLLDQVKITVNKNTIPFETRSPQVTSGIRLGTPAVTTRGFKEEDCQQVARLIIQALESNDQEEVLDQVRQGVANLTKAIPLYK